MAILVEGFMLVFRLEAIEAGYPGGWDGFCSDRLNERICWDGALAGVACGSRVELRAYLGRLAERGLAEAAVLLETTELSRKVRTAAEEEALRDRQVATTELALVYRYQRRRVPWLEVAVGPSPGGRGSVCGCFLAGGPAGELAWPAGWTPERAVDPYDEPGDGDEYLPTWDEFLRWLRPDLQAKLIQDGPDVTRALHEITGERLFAGRVRPGGRVVEQRRIERDADGKEREVIDRWVKL